MPRVRFLADHDDRPKRNVIVAYKAGHEVPVKQALADELVAAGKAELVEDKQAGSQES